MAIRPGTIDDVQHAFNEVMKSLHNCEIAQDLTGYDSLFKGLCEHKWTTVEDSGVEYIVIDCNTTIFRVACQVTLDFYREGIGNEIVTKIQKNKKNLIHIAKGATKVAVYISPSITKDAPFGKEIHLLARGIIYYN